MDDGGNYDGSTVEQGMCDCDQERVQKGGCLKSDCGGKKNERLFLVCEYPLNSGDGMSGCWEDREGHLRQEDGDRHMHRTLLCNF